MPKVYFLSFELLLGESLPVQRAYIVSISELRFCVQDLEDFLGLDMGIGFKTS